MLETGFLGGSRQRKHMDGAEYQANEMGTFKIFVFTKPKYNHIEDKMGLVRSKNGVERKFILIGISKRN
jgi:hypothetical protein